MNNYDAHFASYAAAAAPQTQTPTYTVGKHLLALLAMVAGTIGFTASFATVGAVIDATVNPSDFLPGVMGLFCGGFVGFVVGVIASAVFVTAARLAHGIFAATTAITVLFFVLGAMINAGFFS